MHHLNHEHSKGKVSYLENLERRKEFSPEQLLSMISLKETDNVLDFGAGTGYFTIPAAKRIRGNVYALDTDADMLKIIKEKASEEQLTNIVLVQGSMKALSLPDGSIDVIIASLVLHEVEPLAPLLQQMKKILKQEGCLVCLELEPKENSEKAPRITLEKMKQEMLKAGFQVTQTILPTEDLHVLIVQPKG